MTRLEDIAKRRGFFWQSSELYGGLSGFYDYGHIGTLIKQKFEALWRSFFLNEDNFYEISPATIMHEKVFQASGHLQSFVDPIVKCKKCKATERADQILEEQLKEKFEGLSSDELGNLIKKHNIRCPKCKGELEPAGTFNLLFPVSIGATSDAITAYLRGETAQGAYVNFRRAFEHLRKKLPIGLAIIGKAYRNEISPRNALIRMREFSQAELQIFFDPDKIDKHPSFEEIKDYELFVVPVGEKQKKMACKDVVKKIGLPEFYVYYMAQVQKFYLDVIKVPQEKIRLKQLSDEEKAFYNKFHWDVELSTSLGFVEVGGIHYRTNHDLKGHEKVSKQKMTVTIENKKVFPHVLELSFGVDRNIYSILDMSLVEEKERSVIKLPRRLSPFDAAIFPLVSKDGLPEKAKELKKNLEIMQLKLFYDESGSIGRRYRRMDEIGVALEDNTVTLRDRDTMKQVRVPLDDVCSAIFQFINGKALDKLGKKK